MNHDKPRIPMTPGADVEASIQPEPRTCGHRFSIVAAENVLRSLGPRAIEHVTVKLAESVVARHQHDIERVVYSFLHDREWAEPLLREAIEKAVANFVRDIFTEPDD